VLTENGEEQQLNTSCLQTLFDNDEVRQLSESAHLICVIPELTENGEQQLNTSCLQTLFDNDEASQMSESVNLGFKKLLPGIFPWTLSYTYIPQHDSTLPSRIKASFSLPLLENDFEIKEWKNYLHHCAHQFCRYS